jgi:hypothetical protein
MWKNVFFESCIISALIFGGFYLNATLLKDELYSAPDTGYRHISGYVQPIEPAKHICGQKTQPDTQPHISGVTTLTP